MGCLQCCIQEEDFLSLSDFDHSDHTQSHLLKSKKRAFTTIYEVNSQLVSSKDIQSFSYMRRGTGADNPAAENDVEWESTCSLTQGIRVRFLNKETGLFLNSHRVPHPLINRAYDVSATKAEYPEYYEWTVINEKGGSLQNNDVVKIEHTLTKNRLCGISDYEKTRIAICCFPRPTEGEDIWRISSNEAPKIGSQVQLIHMRTGAPLSVTKIKGIKPKHWKVSLKQAELKFTLWNIVSLDQSCLTIANSRVQI